MIQYSQNSYGEIKLEHFFKFKNCDNKKDKFEFKMPKELYPPFDRDKGHNNYEIINNNLIFMGTHENVNWFSDDYPGKITKKEHRKCQYAGTIDIFTDCICDKCKKNINPHEEIYKQGISIQIENGNVKRMKELDGIRRKIEFISGSI